MEGRGERERETWSTAHESQVERIVLKTVDSVRLKTDY